MVTKHNGTYCQLKKNQKVSKDSKASIKTPQTTVDGKNPAPIRIPKTFLGGMPENFFWGCRIFSINRMTCCDYVFRKHVVYPKKYSSLFRSFFLRKKGASFKGFFWAPQSFLNTGLSPWICTTSKIKTMEQCLHCDSNLCRFGSN